MNSNSFSFNKYSKGLLSAEAEKYLKDYYDGEENLYGIGYSTGSRTVIITKDFLYSRRFFAPAYHDLHIFEDGKEPKTKKHAVSVLGTSYSDFYVDRITGDNNGVISLALVRHLSPFEKCSDKYLAYAEVDENGRCSLSPFVFSERRAERSSSPAEGAEEYGGCAYVVTDKNGLSEEEALEQSRLHCESERER